MSYGGAPEAERLATVHTDPPACDWCDDGDTPVDGIHLVPDPEGIEGTWRVPCPRGGAA